MPHMLLALDEGVDPAKTELTVTAASDDDTVFEIRDAAASGPRPTPTVGIGYRAVVAAPTLVELGLPTLIEIVTSPCDEEFGP